jgi:hypothetical protein
VFAFDGPSCLDYDDDDESWSLATPIILYMAVPDTTAVISIGGLGGDTIMHVQPFCWSASHRSRSIRHEPTYPLAGPRGSWRGRLHSSGSTLGKSESGNFIARIEVWIVDIPEYELS